MKSTLEGCLGLGVLEFSWVAGRGKTAVDLACEVVLGVPASDHASAP